LRLLESVGKKKRERDTGEIGEILRKLLSRFNTPIHARDDDAFSEGSEVQFVLTFFSEHIFGIVDTRMVF
jgi:hypothetical protein